MNEKGGLNILYTYLIHMSHLKMAIFPADWLTIMCVRLTDYRPLSSVFFMDLQAYTQDIHSDSFIANGAAVEYTKNHLKWHGGWCCFWVY